MHGCGNDFIMLNNSDWSYDWIHENTSLIAKLCTRNFGVGSDGLILLEYEWEQIQYVMYNSDGSKAEMCGNGIRCFYKALQRRWVHDDGLVSVITGAWLLHVQQYDDGMILVDMGIPTIGRHDTLEYYGRPYEYRVVHTWNPHCILMNPENTLWDKDVVCKVWPAVEYMTQYFPKKTNVTFYKIDPDFIDLQVRERWCGYTLACGTATCGTIAWLIVEKIIKPWSHCVKLPGGELVISRDGQPESSIMMAGPAEFVFEGSITI